jgi:glycosyltransferase involved in cell wall biosynthesis
MPLVSIIMTSYNHEKFIFIAIKSVLNQTFTDLELIIIDDASKDNSREIIKDYSKKDGRITTVFHEDNRGIAKTLNEGIEKAGGKYIAFIGSDDVWHKDKLQKQIEILGKNEDLIVWSEGEIIDADGNPTGELFTQKQWASKKKKSGNIFEILLPRNFIFGSSVIFKRKNAKDIRFNEALKYLNDHQYYVDLAKKYEYFFFPESLAQYRIHGGNATLSDERGWLRDRIIINDYFLQSYADEISDKLKGKILLNSSEVFSLFGEKTKAMQYVYQAIRLNPFYLRNLYYLFFAITNKKWFIHKFFVWCYKRCVTLIEKSEGG